jgi:hypothetical protein
MERETSQCRSEQYNLVGTMVKACSSRRIVSTIDHTQIIKFEQKIQIIPVVMLEVALIFSECSNT